MPDNMVSSEQNFKHSLKMAIKVPILFPTAASLAIFSVE